MMAAAMTTMPLSVLIVEDDAGLRQMLTWELEDSGYHVETACGCREAEAMARKFAFDLALLDYCLPDGNGIDLLIALRRMAPNMPVIMSSALTCTETRARALELGASRFLTKPISAGQLNHVFRLAISCHAA